VGNHLRLRWGEGGVKRLLSGLFPGKGTEKEKKKGAEKIGGGGKRISVESGRINPNMAAAFWGLVKHKGEGHNAPKKKQLV